MMWLRPVPFVLRSLHRFVENITVGNVETFFVTNAAMRRYYSKMNHISIISKMNHSSEVKFWKLS